MQHEKFLHNICIVFFRQNFKYMKISLKIHLDKYKNSTLLPSTLYKRIIMDTQITKTLAVQHTTTENITADNQAPIQLGDTAQPIVKVDEANSLLLVTNTNTALLQNLGPKIDQILSGISSLTKIASDLDTRVATITTDIKTLQEKVTHESKKTDTLLKMQDHRHFMEILLQNSKKNINIALNSLFQDDCQELKIILKFAEHDPKWAYELKSILGTNKKYFYAANDPLAASLRESCRPDNESSNLSISQVNTTQHNAKEVDYDKKSIIETMIQCIRGTICSEIYNAESKKVLGKLCDEVAANIGKMFPVNQADAAGNKKV